MCMIVHNNLVSTALVIYYEVLDTNVELMRGLI